MSDVARYRVISLPDPLHLNPHISATPTIFSVLVVRPQLLRNNADSPRILNFTGNSHRVGPAVSVLFLSRRYPIAVDRDQRDIELAVIIAAMDVHLLIFSSNRHTCQVRIWSVTEPTRNWAKRYGSKSECMAELLRLKLLTPQEAVNGRAVSCEKSGADVLAIKANTQRDVLVH
jgi:hypothetical protein